MKIAILSSTGRCGVRDYAHFLLDGLREQGHHVDYVGVPHHDNKTLAQQVRQIKREIDLVIIEYEPAIFSLDGLIWTLVWLRFWLRTRVLLSVHEISSEKYAGTRQIHWHLSRPVKRSGLWELLFLAPALADVIWRFLLYRVGLLLLGKLPHGIVVHSAEGMESLTLAVADKDKIGYIPHLIQQLSLDRDAARRQLELPLDVFAFIVPGFLFRRKRIVDVIQQLPAQVELWIVGTRSTYEPEYVAEIETAIAQLPDPRQVKFIQDYERMEQYLIAADVAIFYYREVFQSGTASLAVGAGKPCIFSNLSGFADLQAAGLRVETPQELHQAMKEIQKPACYASLKEMSLKLRQELSPAKIAADYLDSVAVQTGGLRGHGLPAHSKQREV